MDLFARSLWSGLAIVVVGCAVGFGQTNLTPAVNGCIVPAPRTDERGTNRYVQLCQRVQDCHGQADVIFLGDSITQAWEVEGKEVWAKYYAPRHALNLGIGSDRTQHVLWRLDHGHLAGLKPKVVVVLIGVNNIPDETYTPGMVLEGVTAVVQKLRTKLPETKIILLGIFPFHEDFHRPSGQSPASQPSPSQTRRRPMGSLPRLRLFVYPARRKNLERDDARFRAPDANWLPAMGRRPWNQNWRSCWATSP